ncbi:MAG: sensor histidine kinase [Solirubrobacterales bacterium]|nr:sensor histidine kinase [Solirubrobacterales bacterium]
MAQSHPAGRLARRQQTNALAPQPGVVPQGVGPQRTSVIAPRLAAVPPRMIDVALAGFLVWWTAENSVNDGEPLWATLLLGAAALALVVRRRWPVAVLAFALIPYAVTSETGTGQPAVLVALYTVASLRSERTAVIATVVAVTTSVVTVSVHGDSWDLALARTLEVVFAAILGLVIAEGRARRVREAAMLAQIAAADERIRIARELHDVVAHHLSVMVVQANLASETVKPDQPAFAPTHAIVAEGRQALGDMRRVLGVLHAHDEREEHAPQPGLAALDDLIERVRSTGLKVTLSTEGEPPAISSGLDLTAYRIVQEALTNTLRHAHASHARVSITYSPQGVELEVADDGIGPSNNGLTRTGHGLDGMRERAALFGGKLTAGPNPGRGYLVRADLPL